MARVILRNGVVVDGNILPAEKEIEVSDEFVTEYMDSGVISKVLSVVPAEEKQGKPEKQVKPEKQGEPEKQGKGR